METKQRTTMTEQQRKWIDGLRGLADWAEQHPDSPILEGRLTVYGFARGDKGADVVAQLAQAAKDFGRAAKSSGNGYYNVTRMFGPHKVEVTAPSEEVCERKVVGVETIPAQIVPAHTIPAETREIVEWVCPESLLAAS